MKDTISSPFIPKTTTLDDHEDDQLESLSLRDLPITPSHASPTVDHSPRRNTTSNHSRRSSSSYSDPTSDFFFEFLINNDDHLITTSTADDVIFHGRLLPFTPPPPPPPPRPRRSLSLSSAAARLTRSQLTESPPESHPPIRPSRSLNYRKLHRNRLNSKQKTTNDLLHRNYSSNTSNSRHRVPSDKISTKSSSPWYLLVFGLPVKMHGEMDLKDIKSRQFRRNAPPSTVFSGDRSYTSSASWKFLNVLSCKSHATVDVNHTALPLRNTMI